MGSDMRVKDYAQPIRPDIPSSPGSRPARLPRFLNRALRGGADGGEPDAVPAGGEPGVDVLRGAELLGPGEGLGEGEALPGGAALGWGGAHRASASVDSCRPCSS